jgi:predicted regulator of Ras-like GTPase activity (Roadblock/LC7/MglB family)
MMADLHAESRAARLDRALGDLLAQTPEVEAAAVVSFDGLPMASALPPSMDEDRVAAMSAALLSLGERAAQGLGRGELSQVYIEGDNGTVFLVSCEDEAVLVAVAAKGAKVGMMLYEVRHTARTVADVLRQDEVPVAEPLLSVVQAVQAPVQPAPEPAGYASLREVPVYAPPAPAVPETTPYDVPAVPDHAAAYDPALPDAPAREALAYEAPVYEALVVESPAPVEELPAVPAWSSAYAPVSSVATADQPRWS